jgi:hypothetical protein
MEGASGPSDPAEERIAGIGTGGSRVWDWARRAARWVVDRRLVLVVGLVAAVPVLVSTVRALHAGWTPVFDDAIIATHSFDVLTTHSPLVGVHSDASLASVGPMSSPGPMLFWLLAFQTHFLGDWALPVSMGLINTASIVGVVALARRRGGRVFMFATAVALAAMCRSLPQSMLSEIDNSRAGVLTFTLLLFLAWSVASGEYRLLPLMVLVASFVAQVHLSLGLPCLAVSAVALAGLAISLAGTRGSGANASDEHRRRWLFGALAVALVCWSAPLLDQAFNRPGNFSRIVQTATADQPSFGVRGGWKALVTAIGIPPRWLRSYSTPRLDFPLFNPNRVAVSSCVLILGALTILALLGLRRRRFDVVTGAALALVLSGAVVVFTASTPPRLFLQLTYGLRWASPAGMFTWLVLGWSTAALLRPARSRAADAPSALAAFRWRASAYLAGLAITAIIAIEAATGPQSDFDSFPWAYRPAGTITSRIVARLPHQRAVLVRGGNIGAVFQTAVIYHLRREGYRVVAPTDEFGNLAQKLGAYYSPGGIGTTDRRYDDVLLVDLTNKPVPRGARVIARVAVAGANAGFAEPPADAVTVSVIAASAIGR